MNRPALSPLRWSRPAGQRGLAEAAVGIAIAVLAGALVLALTGNDPFGAYRVLAERTVLRPAGLQESVVRATPLLITGAAVLLGVRAGVWNIGVDGQVLVGAMAAAVAGAWLANAGAGRPALWVGAAAAALLAGGLWAVVPALLRGWFGVNEIITTIMFNYVALSGTAWLVRGPLRDPALVAPQTETIPRELRLMMVGDTRVHVGIVLALAVVLLLGWALRATVAGLELRVVGESPRAARYLLIPVRRYVVGALVLSGALAGLAGGNDVLSTRGTFQAEWNPAYGFAAFALVFLARSNPWGLLPAAALLGMLSYGGDVMPRAAGIDGSFFGFLEGTLLVALALAGWLPGRLRRRGAPGVRP